MNNIFNSIKDACIEIYFELQNSNGLRESFNNNTSNNQSGKINASGDKVLAIDEFADVTIEKHLKLCKAPIIGFASEERKDFVKISNNGDEPGFIVVFDPLDGIRE
eukprot:Pgem_evm1s13185